MIDKDQTYGGGEVPWRANSWVTTGKEEQKEAKETPCGMTVSWTYTPKSYQVVNN
jgi:hypothetical protein